MAYRIAALVAVIVAVALTGGPAHAGWLPSWLDNMVNGASTGAASPTELSSKSAQPLAYAGEQDARSTAARCLSSAAAVRKVQPKAWPKWTYGPRGERCWYAGAKPHFAKRHLHRTTRTASKRTTAVRMAARPAPRPAPEPVSFAPPPAPPAAAAESVGRSHRESPAQPWALEYRWHGSAQ